MCLYLEELEALYGPMPLSDRLAPHNAERVLEMLINLHTGDGAACGCEGCLLVAEIKRLRSILRAINQDLTRMDGKLDRLLDS